MIETTVRSRKEPLKPIKMEDIKIEFVDLCVLPSDGMNIVEMDSDVGSPAAAMEITIPAASPSDPVRPRKRAKLDHLSAEEKAQHRKMMNRISAQSARDRQKALMTQQESAIKTLQNTTDALRKQNAVLAAKNNTLNTENKSLKQENQRLSTLVMQLEAKLKAASPVQNSTVYSSDVQEPSVVSTEQVIKLEVQDENNNCSGSSMEPAEGTIRAASELVAHPAPLDNVSWDFDSPELLQILGEFSEKILGGEQELPELEQLSTVAESLVAQMAAETQTAGSGAEDAGMTVPVPTTPMNDKVNQRSQKSTSENKINLSTPLEVKIDTYAALPVTEPETLQLSGFNFDLRNVSSVSPVPDTTFTNDNVSKQIMMDVDDPKYMNEISELYDMWHTDGIELFPELS